MMHWIAGELQQDSRRTTVF